LIVVGDGNGCILQLFRRPFRSCSAAACFGQRTVWAGEAMSNCGRFLFKRLMQLKCASEHQTQQQKSPPTNMDDTLRAANDSKQLKGEPIESEINSNDRVSFKSTLSDLMMPVQCRPRGSV
jgi:hypothetical protein